MIQSSRATCQYQGHCATKKMALSTNLTHVGTTIQQTGYLIRHDLVDGIRRVKTIKPKVLIDGDATRRDEGVILRCTTVMFSLAFVTYNAWL